MASKKEPITSFAAGVEYLKSVGKYEDNKFKVEKSNVREFYELAGASKPVQESMAKADELLRSSLWHIGAEFLKEEVAKKKAEGVSTDELKNISVQVTALGDAANHRVKFHAAKDVRIPQTNEIVQKYGPVRFTVDAKRTGVTAEDVNSLAKEIEDLFK